MNEFFPVMIYDNKCYLCSKFASIVHIFSKGKILIVGHYSDEGMRIKSMIFENNYESTKMFWFATKKTAYGGRSAILPLIINILTSKPRKNQSHISSSSCIQDCRTIMSFFARTKSLLTNSERIQLEA